MERNDYLHIFRIFPNHDFDRIYWEDLFAAKQFRWDLRAVSFRNFYVKQTILKQSLYHKRGACELSKTNQTIE